MRREQFITVTNDTGARLTVRHRKRRLLRRYPWMALGILPQLACIAITTLSIIGEDGSAGSWMFEHPVLMALMASVAITMGVIPWLCVAEAERANDVLRVRMIMHGLHVPEDDGL